MPSIIKVQVVAATSSLVSLIAIGTLVYKYLEDWTWIQSFYFSVVTLFTLGHGDFHPSANASRLFTAFYIILGVSITISAVAVIGTSYLSRREVKIARRMRKKSADITESP